MNRMWFSSAALWPGADVFPLKDMAPERLVHVVQTLASGVGVRPEATRVGWRLGLVWLSAARTVRGRSR